MKKEPLTYQQQIAFAVPLGTLTSCIVWKLSFTILEPSSEVTLSEQKLVSIR